MGTILASAIVDKAEIILLDDTNVRWASTELLAYLNEGQRAIVLLKPDTNVTTDSYPLVEGTKQSIPDGTSDFQNPTPTTLPA